MDKFVISGGPCAGKSTLLEEMVRRGYKALPEAALLLIEEDATNFRYDPERFSHQVYLKQHELEQNISQDDLILLDRSLIDSVAYYLSRKREVPQDLEDFISQTNYCPDCHSIYYNFHHLSSTSKSRTKNK